MRLKRFLIIGSVSLLGLIFFLGFLLAVLAYSHDRWLPAFLNHYLLSEPVAGLPAESLHLERIELESWQRLSKLTLSGPNNSVLEIQGVTWPFSGELIIDRLSVRLPDQLPQLSSEQPSVASAEHPGVEHLAAGKSASTRNIPAAAPSGKSLLRHELTVRKAYEDYFSQIDSTFEQLEEVRQQYRLHTVTIRAFQIAGLPFKNMASLQYFRGSPGSKQGQPYWQFNLASTVQPVPDQDVTHDANFDLRLHLSTGEHRLNMMLRQLDQLAFESFELPEWVPVKGALDELAQLSNQYGLRLTDTSGKLALQMAPRRADIAIHLPGFDLQAIQGCRLSSTPRTLALTYQISDSGTEKIRFNSGEMLVQNLTGNCLSPLLEFAQVSELHRWLKGLDRQTLRQGGELRVELKEPVVADLTAKSLSISGLNVTWQPQETVSASFQLSAPQIQLTPEKLSLQLISNLKAELQPQPLFANQSRLLDLSMQMSSDVGLGLSAYLAGERASVENPSVIHSLRMDIGNSEITLSPAPNDESVLWAPAGLEIPLFQHDGHWVIELQQPLSEAGRWQFTHQGQGEALVRYPGLRRNVRVPYKADLKLAGLLSVINTDLLIKEVVGDLDWKLASASPRTQDMMNFPASLLPDLTIKTRIEKDKIKNQITGEAELARITEWLALPTGILINDGRLTLQSQSLIDKAFLPDDPESVDTGKLLTRLSSTLALNLSQLTGEAKGYAFGGVNLPLQLTLSEGEVNLEPGVLTAERVFAGIELTNLNADLKAEADVTNIRESLSGQLTGFSADTLGGHIQMGRLDYPFSPGHTSELILKKLDLSQLIALGEKQIRVTGLLNGKLPMKLSQKGVAIHNGQVKSDAGEIVLKDNPAWQAMLQQQPVLASQLKYLNQLHYYLLQGDIEMKENGKLTAILQIKGDNRAEDQPVTLNFTSEQNILTLLRALRLSDQIDKSLSESAQGMYQ